MKRYNDILARLGEQLPSDARILDFGCGAGRIVYRLLDQGYDAHGYDQKDYLELRAPEDRFRFSIGLRKRDG
jgi:2-polyprenyl-3-methyl-5-hydroxy-6-metoxy-1,4-benzoquinol methylase